VHYRKRKSQDPLVRRPPSSSRLAHLKHHPSPHHLTDQSTQKTCTRGGPTRLPRPFDPSSACLCARRPCFFTRKGAQLTRMPRRRACKLGAMPEETTLGTCMGQAWRRRRRPSIASRLPLGSADLIIQRRHSPHSMSHRHLGHPMRPMRHIHTPCLGNSFYALSTHIQ
jgi:hypothetical protein